MQIDKPVIPTWTYSKKYLDTSRKILETALAKAGIYHDWKALDPGRDTPLDRRFAALPALTKKDIRDHFPDGMLPAGTDLKHAVETGEVGLVNTSGTTDDKITNIWNQKWWDASERGSWTLNDHMTKYATGDHREAILVNPKNVGIISDDVELPMEKRRLSRFLYLNEKTDPLRWSEAHLGRMVRELEVYQPAVLEANPSYLARLCRHISASGKSVFQPSVIVFTYEYPTHFHYRQIKKAFPNVPTVSSYGTTETGYVFMQCEHGKLHQNSDFCRVDFQPFTREHGGPLLGRILVTPLNNPWSYLLRFDTGDIVRLEESGQCPCGRDSGMILSSVQGRKVNLTVTLQGRLVTLFELDNTLCQLDGVEEYKLVQSTPATLELFLASSRKDKDAVKGEAVALLKKLYGDRAQIKVKFEDAIAPEESGKYLIARALFPIDLGKYLEARETK